MIQDLLRLRDLEPPMGDLFTHATFAAGRAMWTRPSAHETDLPVRRIIHARVLRLAGRARLDRLGVRKGQGYHKCGSRQDLDWVSGLRVLAWQGGNWRELLHLPEVRKPADDETIWFALGGAEASAVSIEVRRSGIDEGWTPWNLALSAFVLEGELIDPLPPRLERVLDVAPVRLTGLAKGVRASLRDGEVRFATRDFEVGFHLARPGFSFLGLHTEDRANAGQNTLAVQPAFSLQGPRLQELGAVPVMAPAVRFDAVGRTTVRGSTVTYDFVAGSQHYRLAWRVTARGLTLRATRTGAREVVAWHSSAWTIALRNRVSPSQVLGQILPDGETGAVALPLLLNLPRFGTWKLASRTPGVFARSDCFRADDVNTLELKVGEQRTSEGVYRLRRGRHEAIFTLRPVAPPAVLRKNAPRVVQRALARTHFTALTYRADTGTLSNNGASMHCPICLDTWSAVTLPMGEILPGFPATELLRTSLERWLDGGPGYAAGRLMQDGVAHDAADEYLMTDTAGLRGLADFLGHVADRAWFQRHRTRILQRIEAVRRRDLDGDGLIESAYRTGVSGTNQWSTCWYDVVSFGWKDAFANAILHGALRAFVPALQRLGAAREAQTIAGWADQLRTSFHPAFWNEQNGWYAGWRCREGKLHDHAFLAINGAAVALGLTDAARGRSILDRLLAETRRVGMPDAALGLPGNLWPIPDPDLADIMQGYPLGYYQNGGRTHAQTRYLVLALYQVGLAREADRLLERLCSGLADARVFGGNRSGVDWRHWDDRPCGYEGLLTDQFGILEAIFWRWGRGARTTRALRGQAVRR
ncbi:glucosidase family protein [Horticoccus sp. 23ND18S-11]|uniref:hypothetical protein n=1 Tax=Horticoccus sp. 23ND18S-11 TaxID=3391832 RepID=UPI0039C98ADF